jgi:hypothetical protein
MLTLVGNSRQRVSRKAEPLPLPCREIRATLRASSGQAPAVRCVQGLKKQGVEEQ